MITSFFMGKIVDITLGWNSASILRKKDGQLYCYYPVVETMLPLGQNRFLLNIVFLLIKIKRQKIIIHRFCGR